MTKQLPFEKRVRRELARFGKEIDEKLMTTILQSTFTDIDLKHLIKSFAQKLRLELVDNVRKTIESQDYPAGSARSIWALAMASVKDDTHLPASPRARELSKTLSIPLQEIAAELAFAWARFEPNRLEIYGTDMLALTPGLALYPKYKVTPACTPYTDFWIALAQQIVREKSKSRKTRAYHAKPAGKGEDTGLCRWHFDGTRQDWMNFLQHLIVHAAGNRTSI